MDPKIKPSIMERWGQRNDTNVTYWTNIHQLSNHSGTGQRERPRNIGSRCIFSRVVSSIAVKCDTTHLQHAIYTRTENLPAEKMHGSRLLVLSHAAWVLKRVCNKTGAVSNKS